jgi:ATP-dependent Clp protease ATP-binding subunit ClpC
MMNQFSPKVSEILSFSREEAERLASTSVGPEHILLGILREKNSPVKELFDTMHLDIEALKNSLEERVRQQNSGRLLFSSDMLLNDMANNILRLAVLTVMSIRNMNLENQSVMMKSSTTSLRYLVR